MKSKRAQFFSIYLVLLTILMCGVIIAFYIFQQSQIMNSIILPNGLLTLESKKDVFEFQEKNIIIQAAKETLSESSSSSDFFLNNFETKFYDYLTSDEQIDFREFIFTDSKYNLKEVLKDNLKDKDSQISFFKSIYTISVQNEILSVSRKSLSKSLFLKPDTKNKISFPLTIDYNLDKEYAIKLNDLENS